MNKCLNCDAETKNPKYCSSSCAAKVNNRIRSAKQKLEKPSTKACKHCNVPIVDRNTYCSIECQHKHQNNEKIAQFIAEKFYDTPVNTGSNSWLRKYLVEVLDYTCSECGIGDTYNGKPITLEIDHINGKSSNNILSNLRFLCPNCHSQTDTYKAKNIKSDRVNRYS